MKEFYFLENYLDIDVTGQATIKLTYLKNEHPPLEQEILDRDIAIRGSKLSSRLFKEEWYIYKQCNVVNIVEYTTQFDTFIIYTISGRYHTSVDNKGEVRKLTIQELLLDSDEQEDEKKLSENQIDGLNIDTLNINSKICP